MRKRDPRHEAQVVVIQALSSSELIQRIGVHDHTDTHYIASEVLATLVRNRFGQTVGALDAAVEFSSWLVTGTPFPSSVSVESGESSVEAT